MKQVCKDVGFDGQGFYCLRCGKSGYKSEAQARGHLAQCRGRAIARGVPSVGIGVLPIRAEMLQQPPIDQTVLPPAYGGHPAGLREGEKGGGATTTSTTTTLGDFCGTPGYVSMEYVQGLQNQINALEATVKFNANHYNHLLMRNNEPQYHAVQQDFFSQYKGVIIVGAIILFAVILLKQSNQCPAGSGSKGIGVGDIGTKALTKLVDVGISKGISSIFK